MSDLLVHEWIEKIGGSEKVLEQMASALPSATIATLWSNDPGRFPGHELIESRLARTPLRRNKALALPLMSTMWKSLDLRNVDRVVVSSHSFAHHVGAGPQQGGVSRFVYVHSPARWIWARDLDARGNAFVARLALPILKAHDRRAVRPGAYAANSAYIAERMRRSWGVEAAVIYPPVDTAALLAGGNWADKLAGTDHDIAASLPPVFVLGASRFIDYKKLDVVIDFAERVDVPAVIAGSGPLLQQLQRRANDAKVPVIVVERPSDQLLRAMMQLAAAFVYPPIEDFGIMPVEAYALGTPALVNEVGGAKEAAEVTGGGAVIDFSAPETWSEAFDTVTRRDSSFARDAHLAFSHERFASEFHQWLDGHG